MTRSRSPRPLLLAVTGVALVVLGACAPQTQPREYGEQYEENFMFGCTGADPGDPPTLASTAYCECLYGEYVEKVPFAEVEAFEQAQAEAADGADIVIPDNIQAVIDGCAATTDPAPPAT